MKFLLLLLAGLLFIAAIFCLSACGTTRADRVGIYKTGAAISGHPEALPAIIILDKLIPAKQPRIQLQPK